MIHLGDKGDKRDNLSFMNSCKSSNYNFSKILETERKTFIGR